MNPRQLQNKVVLVTGGSRGIGRQIVLGAVACGARVVFCARTLTAGAQDLQEIGGLAGSAQVLAVRADVGCEGDVDMVFDTAIQAFGRVDVVVNNAGVSREALLLSLPAETWDQVLATNLTGAFLVSRRAIRAFLQQGQGGTIVSIGSVMQNGAPSNASYAASKGGLVGLTRSIARQYGSLGISAHLVIAGAVETELTRDVPEAMRKAVIEACPLKRQAQAHEIASAVLFLVSRPASLSNGEALYVAGGLREVMV